MAINEKKLMIDLLRYPAKVYYRDDKIVVITTDNDKAYDYFSNNYRAHAINGARHMHIASNYIIRTYTNDVFVLQKQFQFSFAPNDHFSFGVVWPEVSDDGRNIEKMAKAYPSIYSAFEKEAKKVAFLPLIQKQSKHDIYRALKNMVSNISYVHNLTHKRCIAIINDFPGAIKYIDQSLEIAHHMIRTHGGDYLRDIDERYRTEKLCLLAVKNDAFAIRHVPEQTEQLSLLAVKTDGRALKYIRNPSFNVKVFAYNSHPDARALIKSEKERRRIKKVRNQKKYKCTS